MPEYSQEQLALAARQGITPSELYDLTLEANNCSIFSIEEFEQEVMYS